MIKNLSFSSNRPAIQIRSEHKDTSPDGSYNFSYESENGIVVQESGAPRAAGPEGPAEVRAQMSNSFG